MTPSAWPVVTGSPLLARKSKARPRSGRPPGRRPAGPAPPAGTAAGAWPARRRGRRPSRRRRRRWAGCGSGRSWRSTARAGLVDHPVAGGHVEVGAAPVPPAGVAHRRGEQVVTVAVQPRHLALAGQVAERPPAAQALGVLEEHELPAGRAGEGSHRRSVPRPTSDLPSLLGPAHAAHAGLTSAGGHQAPWLSELTGRERLLPRGQRGSRQVELTTPWRADSRGRGSRFAPEAGTAQALTTSTGPTPSPSDADRRRRPHPLRRPGAPGGVATPTSLRTTAAVGSPRLLRRRHAGRPATSATPPGRRPRHDESVALRSESVERRA